MIATSLLVWVDKTDPIKNKLCHVLYEESATPHREGPCLKQTIVMKETDSPNALKLQIAYTSCHINYLNTKTFFQNWGNRVKFRSGVKLIVPSS